MSHYPTKDLKYMEKLLKKQVKINIKIKHNIEN